MNRKLLGLLFAFFLHAQSAHATFTLVAHACQNSGSGSVTVNSGSAGNLALVQVGALNAPSPIVLPTDSNTNTWTGLTNVTSGFGGGGRLFYSVLTSAGASHTFSTSQSFASICVQVWSGANASPFDQEATGNSGVISPASAAAITPSVPNALVVATWTEASTATPTIDSGFTISDTAAGIGGTSYGASMAYLVQTTATMVDPTWTWSGVAAGIELTAFIPSTGGGVISSPPCMLRLLGIGCH